MAQSLKKIFSEQAAHAVPAGLFEKIFSQISLRQRKRAVWRFGICCAVLAINATLLLPAVGWVHNAMVQSGSYNFISLLFSNFSEVASSWQDFVLSVLEYLPVTSIAIFLTTIFLLLISLRFITRDVKILFYRHF